MCAIFHFSHIENSLYTDGDKWNTSARFSSLFSRALRVHGQVSVLYCTVLYVRRHFKATLSDRSIASSICSVLFCCVRSYTQPKCIQIYICSVVDILFGRSFLIPSFLSRKIRAHYILRTCGVFLQSQWLAGLGAVTFGNVDCWIAHERSNTKYCFHNFRVSKPLSWKLILDLEKESTVDKIAYTIGSFVKVR